MGALIMLGGAGGTLAVLSAIVVVARGIFRQVSATEDNTDALNKLTGRVESVATIQQRDHTDYERRLAVLEDRAKR